MWDICLAALVIALGLIAWYAITRDVQPEDLHDNEM